MNLPNRLTILRILMVPVFVSALAYWTPQRDYCRLIALAVFLLACVTDALDGWIARRTGQKTRLGSLIDPLADKILLTSAYLALAWIRGIPADSRLPVWLTVLVISRDLLLVTGASIIFMMQNRFDTQTNFLGKLTTVCQMALVIAVLGGATLKSGPSSAEFIVLEALIACVAVTTVLSGAVYLRAGIARLGGGNERV